MVSKGEMYKTKKGVDHPIIRLADTEAQMDDRFKSFSFGLAKAKLIVNNFEDIKLFVEKAEEFVGKRDKQVVEKPKAPEATEFPIK